MQCHIRKRQASKLTTDASLIFDMDNLVLTFQDQESRVSGNNCRFDLDHFVAAGRPENSSPWRSLLSGRAAEISGS